MTADEIREKVAMLVQLTIELHLNHPLLTKELRLAQTVFLGEIAAQLAELNSRRADDNERGAQQDGRHSGIDRRQSKS